MTRIVWGQLGSRRYESGVDCGVLYPATGPGVVWNGLIGVDQGVDGGEVEQYHFDGNKYIDLVSGRNFQAMLRAFSAPAEFAPCLGEVAVRPGFVLTRQLKTRFGLSYRTGSDVGYKIHIVYNATATPSGKNAATLSESVSPTPLELAITAVPPESTTFKPSAHFIADSTRTSASSLLALENKLYGTASAAPGLPTLTELINFFQT
jgi:hypothetical protein